jgi:hypothetical protein
MKKCYLAGPVSGLDRELVVAAFEAAEVAMRELGYVVVNPVRLIDPSVKWNAAMRMLIPALCDCDAIYLIKGWALSIGAAFEYKTAVVCGLKVIGLTSDNKQSITVILDPIVRAAWGVDIEYLRQDTRKREVVEMRQICMWYLDSIGVAIQDDITEYFGRADRSLVSYATKVVNRLRLTDKAFGVKVEDFLKAV